VAPDRPAVSRPQFWEALYASGDDGWDLGGPAPPLSGWLAAGARFLGAEGRPARVAVPGCGRGHDARLLARSGHHVWGFDFAPAAVAGARGMAAREGLDVRYEQRDVFALGRDYAGFFDAVWEYTCFCAIDPARRGEYAKVLHAIVRPGGTLLACFYPMREGEDGPPFPVSRPELERVLAPYWDVIDDGPPARSAERRQGLEWLVRALRRP
jgi:SAM-dependent methyltransferase